MSIVLISLSCPKAFGAQPREGAGEFSHLGAPADQENPHQLKAGYDEVT